VESLKTAFAQDTYGRKITATTSDTAMENDAILAINGDFYGARERGYVIRNGILYRDTPSNADVLCIYTDGRMEIVDPQEKSAQELLDNGAWQVFSFGPGLLEDGEILVDTNDEVGMSMASNPRTAIGMIEPNHYIFVVSDGRTSDNEGLSLYELADFMKNLGVATAYNLDGGGSSTMVYQGEIINTPSSGRHSRERSVSDIVYIR
jgi:exopolysaccharide biosynthesis protein